MHLTLENGIELKSITSMSAMKGLGNAQRAATFSEERSEGKIIEKFFERLQYFSTVRFGAL